MKDESQFGKGAVKSVEDKRDVQYSDIALGTPDFDWEKGYDIEAELSTILGIPNFKIKSKDQDGSGSCGGQAWSYMGAVLEAIATKTYEERSAKFIYAHTHVQPAGSGARENAQLVINKGWAREAVCSSYENGIPPSEAFMQRLTDITLEAFSDAAKAKGLLYTEIAADIDLFAKAMRDGHVGVLGIYGMNNGTWVSPFPKPPITQGGWWAHWLMFGKAKMINGVKHIGVKNSWGNVGEDGWQWLSEDYFKSIGAQKFIWYGQTMLFKGEDPSFHHTFTQNLKVGSSGDEVKALQKALTLEGMFKGTIDGKFGPITQGSVRAFQTRYALMVDGKVGPQTNAQLNKLYA